MPPPPNCYFRYTITRFPSGQPPPPSCSLGQYPTRFIPKHMMKHMVAVFPASPRSPTAKVGMDGLVQCIWSTSEHGFGSNGQPGHGEAGSVPSGGHGKATQTSIARCGATSTDQRVILSRMAAFRHICPNGGKYCPKHTLSMLCKAVSAVQMPSQHHCGPSQSPGSSHVPGTVAKVTGGRAVLYRATPTPTQETCGATPAKPQAHFSRPSPAQRSAVAATGSPHAPRARSV